MIIIYYNYTTSTYNIIILIIKLPSNLFWMANIFGFVPIHILNYYNNCIVKSNFSIYIQCLMKYFLFVVLIYFLIYSPNHLTFLGIYINTIHKQFKKFTIDNFIEVNKYFVR